MPPKIVARSKPKRRKFNPKKAALTPFKANPRRRQSDLKSLTGEVKPPPFLAAPRISVTVPLSLPRLRGRVDNDLQRELAAAGQRLRGGRDDAHAGNGAQLWHQIEENLLSGALPLAPRLEADAGDAQERLRDLEGVPPLGQLHVFLVHF